MRRHAILAALVCAGLPVVAAASPVTGQISLGGYGEGTSGGSVAPMGMATGVSFANASGTSVSGTSGLINSYGAGSGSFGLLGACLSSSTGCGTIKDIANFATASNISPFISLNSSSVAVTFDLVSISSVGHATGPDGGSLTFRGLGTLYMTGFDPTAGTFILTTQGSNITSFAATLIAATPTTPAVVEPATWAMLMTGFGAVGTAARRRRLVQRSA